MNDDKSLSYLHKSLPNNTEKYEIMVKLINSYKNEIDINNNNLEKLLKICLIKESIRIKFIEYLKKKLKIDYLVKFLDRSHLNRDEYYRRWICIKNFIDFKNGTNVLEDEERCILNETIYEKNFFSLPISSYHELSLGKG